MSAQLHVSPDRAALVADAADRLVRAIGDAIAARGRAVVAVTGGTVGIELLAALADRPIDWSHVHVTWSDERFVEAGSGDRNAVQAREALLDRVAIPATNVHELPAAGSGTLDQAALQATALLEHLGGVDVTLLGVGPDAHIASLFPGRPGVAEAGARIIAVRDSPKPPPERLSFTLDAIAASERTWLVVAGADKAEAVRLALSDAGPAEAPVAHARGRVETLLLADADAASLVA